MRLRSSKIFIKSKSIKNSTVPILFILTFILVLFNKTDYFLINKIKNSGADVIIPISKIISYPIDLLSNSVIYISELRLAKKENSKLKEEIIRLKKWQILALKNTNENSAYKKLLNSTSNELNIIKTALVNYHSPKIYAKLVKVNAGLNFQLEENYPVINERGLVGKIILVSNNNSNILLINDQNFSVPIKSHNKELYAILKGEANGKYLISSFIKDNKKFSVGDILVTSGNAGIFPKNILVGKIIKISDGKIIALPFVDTKNLEFVQIIKNN